MKNLFSYIIRPFVIIRANVGYIYTKYKCDAEFEKDGIKRWVLVNDRHKLCILTYAEIKRLRRTGVMRPDSNLRVLREECFYSTEGLTQQEIETKKRAWIKYCKYCSLA